jgi:hypothetical protein
VSRHLSLASLFVTALCVAGCSDDSNDNDNNAGNAGTTMINNGGAGGGSGAGGATANAGDLSFFVSSQTNSGDLGGVEGADAICDRLATAVGAGSKTWHAYLSAEDGGNGSPVNARDRIGTGPWMNANGAVIAANLTALHDPLATGDSDKMLDENGGKINGQWAGSPAPVQHDIMTGSNRDGTLLPGTTCNSWTAGTADVAGPTVGHSDGMGPGMSTAEPYFSWNSSHAAMDCSVPGLAARGGAGRIYCFAL